MKCPLWMMGGIGSVNRYNEALGDCLEKECAWWDEVPKRCLVFSIRSELYILNETLLWLKERK